MAIKKIIIILTFIGLVLPNFSLAQTQPVSPPETLEEAKEIGERALEAGEKELPGIIKKIWEKEVIPFWQKMWSWVKENIWSKIENRIKPEVEKRKQIFEEGFEREKGEMKEEIKTEVPKATKSLWEKFKELIR